MTVDEMITNMLIPESYTKPSPSNQPQHEEQNYETNGLVLTCL